MVNYRRSRVPGGTYFFTVTLADRQSHLLTDRIELLREAIASVKQKHPFQIDAMVVLPEHLHALWTLPPDDCDYGNRWRSIKSAFVRALRQSGQQLAPNLKGEHSVWQRRFWEHTIRDDADFARHADYIHWNPVKHSSVHRVADWPHSSFHRHVRLGLRPADWASPGYDENDLRE